MSLTKQEKRLYIREVAKELYANNETKSTDAIRYAVELADELEAFERKQDEEELIITDCKKSCFGKGLTNLDDDYCKRTCYAFSQCQEKRGAK